MRKRANGEGSIRKRSNGTWEARVTVGVNPETGKLISKSVYGRTQKVVREKLNALQKGEQQAVNPPAAGPGIASEAANEPEQKEKDLAYAAKLDKIMNLFVDADDEYY